MYEEVHRDLRKVSNLYQKIHLNRYWRLLLESWVWFHGFSVAVMVATGKLSGKLICILPNRTNKSKLRRLVDWIGSLYFRLRFRDTFVHHSTVWITLLAKDQSLLAYLTSGGLAYFCNHCCLSYTIHSKQEHRSRLGQYSSWSMGLLLCSMADFVWTEKNNARKTDYKGTTGAWSYYMHYLRYLRHCGLGISEVCGQHGHSFYDWNLCVGVPEYHRMCNQLVLYAKATSLRRECYS